MSFQNSQPKLPFWGYTNETRHTQVLLLCKKKHQLPKSLMLLVDSIYYFTSIYQYNIADDILYMVYFSEKINRFIMTHQAGEPRKPHIFFQRRWRRSAAINWLPAPASESKTIDQVMGSPMGTLWLCQNSYWKWPFIVDLPWFSH